MLSGLGKSKPQSIATAGAGATTSAPAPFITTPAPFASAPGSGGSGGSGGAASNGSSKPTAPVSKSIGQIRESLCTRPSECMCVGFCTPQDDDAAGSFAKSRVIPQYKMPPFYTPHPPLPQPTNEQLSQIEQTANTPNDTSKAVIHVHSATVPTAGSGGSGGGTGTGSGSGSGASAAGAGGDTKSSTAIGGALFYGGANNPTSPTAPAPTPVAPVDSKWQSPHDPYGAAVAGTKPPSATNSIAAFKDLTKAATAALEADAKAGAGGGGGGAVSNGADGKPVHTIFATYEQANVAYRAYKFDGPLCPPVTDSEVNTNPYEKWRSHPNWHHTGSLAPRIMAIHNSFRNDLRNLTSYYNRISAYGDAAFRHFRSEFFDEVRYVDGHHRCEEEHVFPRLEELAHTTMNTPLLEGQHHDRMYSSPVPSFSLPSSVSVRRLICCCVCVVLTRTAAVMSILMAKPENESQRHQLVHDLGLEYDAWQTVFLNHLRDEEQLTMPLFLNVGRKYWGENLRWW